MVVLDQIRTVDKARLIKNSDGSSRKQYKQLTAVIQEMLVD